MKHSFFKQTLWAILLAFLSATAFVPARLSADEPAKAQQATGKCMMWKVSSPTATVYLVGSMHLATPAMYPLPKEMEAAFASADTLVVEVNIEKIDQAKMMAFVQEKGMYGGNEKLSDNLKPETWEKLKDQCEKLGLFEAGIQKMKPWLLSMTMQVLQVQKLGLDSSLGIDKHFLDLAAKKGTKVDELESAEFQMNLLAGLDAKAQEHQLVRALDESKNLKEDVADIEQAWIAGDPTAMEKQLTKRQKDHPEAAAAAQKLIYDRNGPMAEKVEAYLKGNKTVFVIAGCAHMVGDKGIVRILQKDNFKVDQSTATPEGNVERK
ncbi:MAG TPA: TraB/GumN family protein [Tepidisphaeraceae bacterium]|jgi:hypothetical protein|nr:TraB/GumN family protein [Tepidisphaeraceae bacterium]